MSVVGEQAVVMVAVAQPMAIPSPMPGADYTESAREPLSPQRTKMSGIKTAILVMLFFALVGFAVGVATDAIYFDNTANGMPTFGYWGRCDANSVNPTCHNFVSDYFHCTKGDSLQAYFYSTNFNLFTVDGNTMLVNGVDTKACTHMMVSEAFGCSAIFFSFLALVCTALSHLTAFRHSSTISALLSSSSGIIAIVVFFTIVPQGANTLTNKNGDSYTDYTTQGNFKLFYGFALQCMGIVLSFAGGMTSLCADRHY